MQLEDNYQLARIIYGEEMNLAAFISPIRLGGPQAQRGDPVPQDYTDVLKDHCRRRGVSAILWSYSGKARIQAELAGTAGPDTGPTMTWAEIKDSPVVRAFSSPLRGVAYPATA
jgi:hypothetical protein